jgi:hypothetical protein
VPDEPVVLLETEIPVVEDPVVAVDSAFQQRVELPD